jgi:hypothetical protein
LKTIVPLHYQSKKAANMVYFNLIAYAIYAILTYLITVRVGWLCYQNGLHFVKLAIEAQHLAISVNKLLLVGYYLINLGYITLMIYSWETIDTWQELVESLSQKMAFIVLLLGAMHYFNLGVLYFLGKNVFAKHKF